MKIVSHCGLTRSAGGLFYAVSALSKSLIQQGIDISVLGRGNRRELETDRLTWAPARTIVYKGFGPLGSAPDLRKKIVLQQPDLIHQHGIWMGDQWASLRWQKKTGRPVVVSPHGMLDPWAVENAAWKKKLVGKLFANESLKAASCIHALCRSEVAAIRAYGLTNPIAVIPNGVDLPELAPASGQQDSKEKRQLLFLGRIHPKKGLAELVSGWAKAKKKDPKNSDAWQLLIAGWDDGNHLAGLKQLASHSGLRWADTSSVDAVSSGTRSSSAEICFLGPQFGNAKAQLLHSADAFILPSFSEGLPMSILEAWSYGLPVVMTEFCNIPEGYEMDAALKIEPDADSVATGLSSLFASSQEELKKLGSNGRALVERSFTWDHIAQDMKEVYEWCLGGERPECVEM